MAENFVDIIGYQLEKIHTGMIAWLLDSERSPLPLVEQTEVIAELAPDFLPRMNVTEVKSTREYSFGRRLRIDLVLEMNLEDQTKTYLLIECKTDSDVSVDQLTRSAEEFSKQKPDVPQGNLKSRTFPFRSSLSQLAQVSLPSRTSYKTSSNRNFTR